MRLIEDLKYAKIVIPRRKSIIVLNQLKEIPRTGKLIRLSKFDEPIRIRTIYDHIISLAITADILLKELINPIKDSDIIDLAKCIVYHDLCEVILGDIPAYTNLPTNGNKERLAVERLLRRLDSKTLKQTSNDFLAMFLEDREKSNLNYTYNIIYGSQDNISKLNISKFFNLIDKIDPIISVWRYIDFYRKNSNFAITKFTLLLRDFFENHHVKEIAKEYKYDNRIYIFISALMDINLANNYFKEKKVINDIIANANLNNNTSKLFDIDLFYSDTIYSIKNNHTQH
ncbi:MAG: HD domain-containing protein [Saprospiraceae bacterium]|nr:HD domain-containing protein [Saprospiraceae bacterium]MCC6841879.1 HD domain-containing protein [Saprospiraceae bacterium]